jgi:hypothetical protein
MASEHSHPRSDIAPAPGFGAIDFPLPNVPTGSGSVAWQNPVSGMWTDAADWSGGAVPTASSDVTVGVAGTYTISIDSAVVAQSLGIDVASVTVSETAAGSLALGSTLSITAGTFALASAASLAAPIVTIGSAGVLVASGGTLRGELLTSGLIYVGTGTLTVSGGGTLTGKLKGAGTLALGAGDYVSTGGTLAGNGTLAVYGPANLSVSTGFEEQIATALVLGLAGAAYDGATSLDGPGTLITAGTTTINASGARVEVTLADALTWTNTGTVFDSGVIEADNVANSVVAITNTAGAQFDLLGANASLTANITGTALFSNAGTLAKTGSGVSDFYATVNTGWIDVASGTLSLSGLSGSGSVAVAAGATLLSEGVDVEGGLISGGGTLMIGAGVFSASVAQLAGLGALVVAGGTVNVSGAAASLGVATTLTSGTISLAAGIDITVSGAILDVTGGEVEGPGTLTITGAETFSDPFTLGGSLTLVNIGTLRQTATSMVVDNASSILNQAGATYELSGGGFTGSESYDFENNGTLTIGTTGDLSGTLVNSGLINLDGTLLTITSLSGGGTIDFAAGSELEIGIGGNSNIAFSGSNGTLVLNGGYYTAASTDWSGVSVLIEQDYGTVALGGTTVAAATSIQANGSLLLTTSTYATLTGSLAVSLGTISIAGGADLFALGALSFNMPCAVGGNGTFTTSTGFTLADNGNHPDITETGTLTWQSYGAVADYGAFGNSGTFDNEVGASFALVGRDAALDGGIFINDGTIVRGGIGTTSAIGAAVDNNGVIDVLSGTLAVGALSGGGSLMLGAGATLEIQNSSQSSITISGAAGTLAFNGSYYDTIFTFTVTELQGAGTVTEESGTLSIAGGASALSSIFDLSGGTLDISAGTLTLTNTVFFSGGLISGSDTLLTTGPTVIYDDGGNAAMNIFPDGTVWDNMGTVNDAGLISFIYGESGTATILNSANGTFNLTSDDTQIYNNGMYTGFISALTFINAGELNKSGGTATSTIQIAIDNTGTITAESGTLALDGTIVNTGKIVAADGATVDLSSGTLTSLTGTVLTDGTLRADTSSIIELAKDTRIVVDAGNLTLDGAGSEIQSLNTKTGSQILLDETLRDIAAGGTLSVVDGRSFLATAANGTFFTGGTLILASATFAATALVVTETGTIIGDDAVVTADVTNAGLISAEKGSLSFLGTLTNTGTILASGESVSVSGTLLGTGTLDIGSAGTLSLIHGAAATEMVDFLAGGGLMSLSAPLKTTASIHGFGAGDIIDLVDKGATRLSFANGVLQVRDNGSVVANLSFAGNYTTANFGISSDQHGGTFITFLQ